VLLTFHGAEDYTANIEFRGFNMFELFKCYIVQFKPCCAHI
jgi:hypothetical protein